MYKVNERETTLIFDSPARKCTLSHYLINATNCPKWLGDTTSFPNSPAFDLFGLLKAAFRGSKFLNK